MTSPAVASIWILNYCRTKVRFGVVEAINGNIRVLINRERGYKNMRYLLLKAEIADLDVEPEELGYISRLTLCRLRLDAW